MFKLYLNLKFKPIVFSIFKLESDGLISQKLILSYRGKTNNYIKATEQSFYQARNGNKNHFF